MYVTRRLRDAPSIAILVAFVALTLYPLAFMVITSFKDLAQYNEQFWLPVWPLHPHRRALAMPKSTAG